MTDEEILYDDGKIKIAYLPKRDGHSLIIGERLVFLPRGCLEELSRASIHDLRNKIDAIDPDFKYFPLPKFGIGAPIDKISIALAQARIKELEEELSSAYRVS